MHDTHLLSRIYRRVDCWMLVRCNVLQTAKGETRSMEYVNYDSCFMYINIPLTHDLMNL